MEESQRDSIKPDVRQRYPRNKIPKSRRKCPWDIIVVFSISSINPEKIYWGRKDAIRTKTCPIS